MDIKEVLLRWSQYIDVLFEDDTREIPGITEEIYGPDFQGSEVHRHALNEVKEKMMMESW